MSRCCRTPIPKSPGSGCRCLAKTLKHRKVKKTHQKAKKRSAGAGARASSGRRDAVLLHGLAEQADVLRRCLAIVDDAPVVFPGHRIQIALAQKTLIVRLHQLVDGVGITAVFVVVHLDRPGILLSAVDGFNFLIAADRFRHLGRRDGQRQHNQQHHEQERRAAESLLPVRRAGLCRICVCAHWRRGSVCVLWYGMSSTWTDAVPILTTR